MNPETRSISVSSALSLVLHAALLIAVWQTQAAITATGRGVEIELVSSKYISTDSETEKAARQASASTPQSVTDALPARDKSGPAVRQQVAERPEASKLQNNTSQPSTAVNDDAGEKMVTRSTGAAMNSHHIVDLLHTKISEHKQYPYLARRQRREGTARVEFMLYPDGSIDAARLLSSSKTRSLDNAALDAVESIEPFSYARDYLDRPETFQVDVVFNVM
jgi:TonB family protein